MTNLPSAKRHFSHVTKNRIFKNLNLRKKADRNFAAISWKTISGTYWYVEVHHQRRLKSTKTGIFFLISDSIPPRNQKFGLFSMGKVLYKKIL